MHAKTFLRADKLRLLVDVSGPMAGVDEVGRGPLAGPVVAAAVILDDRRTIRGLNDSKLLQAEERERLDVEIRGKAIAWFVAEASVEEIDRINILRAALLAMRRAVEGLRQQPTIVLVDGNQRPDVTMAVRTVVGGDAKVRAISAASIIAKVYRDRLSAGSARRASGVRLRRTQGLFDARTSRRVAAARRLQAPPAQLRTGARRPGPVVLIRHRCVAVKITRISARDNPLLVRLRKLAKRPSGYRKDGVAMLEGEHLCDAWVRRGALPAQQALVTESAWSSGKVAALANQAQAIVVLADALMAELGTLDTPASIAFVVALPKTAGHRARAARPSCSTGSRMPATSARSCAARRPSDSDR